MGIWYEVVLWMLSIASAAIWIGRGFNVAPNGPARPDLPDERNSDAFQQYRMQWVPLGLFDTLMVLVTWLALCYFAFTIIERQIPTLTPKLIAAAATAVGSTVVVLVFATLWRRAYPGIFAWFGRDGQTIGQMTVDGLRRVVMVLPPLLLIHRALSELVPYSHDTIDALVSNEGFSAILILWYSAVIAAPLFEEFVFRGVLLHWLGNLARISPTAIHRVVWGHWIRSDERSPNEANGSDARSPLSSSKVSLPKQCPASHERMGTNRQLPWTLGPRDWFPVVTSAALFGAMHWSQGLAAVPLFGLGVFLAVLALKSRSLWPCIIVHALFNAYSMFWGTLQVVLLSE